ncbi:MAG TPA: cysteine desulfurase NifS [Clostridiales bacterium]|jgi:cysteine desulfurase|nr:cysteine desulfurase NifS [Clostridiales bacterium]
MKIYADNAATTRVSDHALKAMMPYFQEQYGNPSSLYELGQKAQEALDDARGRMARLLNCQAREIIFTGGGSEANNQAILTAAKLGAKQGKKHIISTAFEHHAVLHPLEALKEEGFDITLLDVHEHGLVTAEEVAQAIRSDTCLVTIMFANNEIGTIQPIKEIGKVCKEKGVLFHTDAVQAVGHEPIDVQDMNIDMLSLSAHKFHGPKGVGALYVKRGIVIAPLIRGGAQEKNKRAGTENVPLIMGMAAAMEDACENMEENSVKIRQMRDYLIDEISQIPHSVLNGDRQQRLSGNVNFCFEGIEGEGLLLLLDDKGVCASSGSACTSGSLDPSHVLLSIGRPHEIAHGSLRLSICEDNTIEEMQAIVRAVKEVVEYLRSISPVWTDLKQGKQQHII